MKKKRRGAEPETTPEQGEASEGENINPMDLPDEPVDSNEPLKFAPGPGVPVSEEEFARLKKRAETPTKAPKKRTKEDR